MPRYIVVLENSETDFRAEVGMEIAVDASIRREAAKLVSEFIADELTPALMCDEQWSVTVYNSQGDSIAAMNAVATRVRHTNH